MKHRFSWTAISLATGEKYARTSVMRSRDWGWDVECSCGFKTNTGGALRPSIQRSIAWHLAMTEEGN